MKKVTVSPECGIPSWVTRWKEMTRKMEAALKTYSDEELERLLIQADEEGDSQLLSMIEDEQIDREPVVEDEPLDLVDDMEFVRDHPRTYLTEHANL